MNDSSTLVLVDTDVWSHVVLARSSTPQAHAWRTQLIGRTVFLSAQTVGELRFGAYKNGWAKPRLDKLESLIVESRVIYPNRDVVEAWARLRGRQAAQAITSTTKCIWETPGSPRRRSPSTSRSSQVTAVMTECQDSASSDDDRLRTTH